MSEDKILTADAVRDLMLNPKSSERAKEIHDKISKIEKNILNASKQGADHIKLSINADMRGIYKCALEMRGFFVEYCKTKSLINEEYDLFIAWTIEKPEFYNVISKNNAMLQYT